MRILISWRGGYLGPVFDPQVMGPDPFSGPARKSKMGGKKSKRQSLVQQKWPAHGQGNYRSQLSLQLLVNSPNTVRVVFPGFCGNKWRPTKWEQAKSISSELALARQTPTITRTLAGLKSRQKSDKFSQWRRGMALGVPQLKAVDMGMCRRVSKK